MRWSGLLALKVFQDRYHSGQVISPAASLLAAASETKTSCMRRPCQIDHKTCFHCQRKHAGPKSKGRTHPKTHTAWRLMDPPSTQLLLPSHLQPHPNRSFSLVQARLSCPGTARWKRRPCRTRGCQSACCARSSCPSGSRPCTSS